MYNLKHNHNHSGEKMLKSQYLQGLETDKTDPIYWRFNSQVGTPLVIICGVHGNETAPIEMIDRIVFEIEQKQLTPKRPLLIITAHPEAIRQNKRFIGTNLNRLFNHSAAGSYPEIELANKIKAEIISFGRQYDLAEADAYDFHTTIRSSDIGRFAMAPLNEKLASQQLKKLSQLGIEAIVKSSPQASTLSAWLKRTFGCHAYTLELGKAMPFGANDPDDTSQPEIALRQLISETIPKISNHKTPQQFVAAREIIKQSSEFIFHIPADVSNFTAFGKDTLIASDSGLLVRTLEDTEYLLFPNPSVEIGARAGLLLRAVRDLSK